MVVDYYVAYMGDLATTDVGEVTDDPTYRTMGVGRNFDTLLDGGDGCRFPHRDRPARGRITKAAR